MENRHSVIRLILCLALAAVILFSLEVSFAEEDPSIPIHPQNSFNVGVSSNSADPLTWNLNENGVLTIRGTGPMQDYEWGEAPWLSNSSAI